MLIENNRTLTTLVTVLIAFLILQSLFGLLSSYVVLPMMQSKSQGYDGMSVYYKVQGFIYSAFNIIDFILLLIIGIQLKHATIRVLVFVYAFLQLGWALFPLVQALTGRM
jgi:hypothetical protein